jgi:hypothetical protein
MDDTAQMSGGFEVAPVGGDEWDAVLECDGMVERVEEIGSRVALRRNGINARRRGRRARRAFAAEFCTVALCFGRARTIDVRCCMPPTSD